MNECWLIKGERCIKIGNNRRPCLFSCSKFYRAVELRKEELRKEFGNAEDHSDGGDSNVGGTS